MQNEACIKQGSEKESFRMQLNEAMSLVDAYAKCADFDVVEKAAVLSIQEAGTLHKMSPKAYVQAVAAITTFIDKRKELLMQGYAAYQQGDFSVFEGLQNAVKAYSTARAVLLGFQKSLSPDGWNILEE